MPCAAYSRVGAITGVQAGPHVFVGTGPMRLLPSSS
jgi:hypothetical protein